MYTTDTQKHKVFLIMGSTRPQRICEQIATWIKGLNDASSSIELELIDLRDSNLPMFDEPQSPKMGNYTHAHTKAWAAKINEAEGFIFLTPEYNAGYPSVLKNAIDFIYKEWKEKPTAIVSYGYSGGASAAKQLTEVFVRIGMDLVDPQAQLIITQEMFNEQWLLKEPAEVFATQADGVKATLTALAKAFVA